MKCIRLAAAAAFLALAACSPSATEPAASSADRPSFDGGNGMGSGNYMDSDSTANTTGIQSDSTDITGEERGGGMMGSGN